ncbi:MAG: hypothetical protein FJ320_04470 [SAR202 cluster bacterium]|nr:hypothetical protein [SAR202 cluster bacterium]
MPFPIYITTIFALLTAILFSLSIASANGIHPSSEEIFNGPIGPYTARVLAVRQGSQFHLTIAIVDTSSAILPSRPTVVVRGQSVAEPGLTIGPATAEPSSAGEQWHTVTFPAPKPSQWRFHMTINGPLGQASTNFEGPIREGGGFNWFYPIAAIAALAGAWGYLAWRRNQALKKITRLKQSP